MIECFAVDFGTAYRKLCELIIVAHRFDHENHAKTVRDQIVSKAQLYALSADSLTPMLKQLERFEMKSALEKGKRFNAQLLNQQNNWTADRLLDAAKEFRSEVDAELGRHRFALLLSPNDQYFDQDRLFGDAVYKKLPTARSDVKDAGNTYATELYTSAVFHLMRASEHGLRAMARRLKVAIKENGNKIPLEYGDWNKLITAIGSKIHEARKITSAARKNARVDYYSDALDRCTAMKDLYRNPVSHARKRYNQGEALGVLQRVRDFMQFLARAVPR